MKNSIKNTDKYNFPLRGLKNHFIHSLNKIPFSQKSHSNPAGDQPVAIDALSSAIKYSERFVALEGVTGKNVHYGQGYRERTAADHHHDP